MKKRQSNELNKIANRVDTFISMAFASGVLLVIALFVYVLMTEVYQKAP